MKTIKYIFSNFKKAILDYAVIWPQLIIFQLFARLIQFCVFGLFSLFAFQWIKAEDIIASTSNFDILRSIDPAQLTVLIFVFSLTGILALFYEYLGMIFIADTYYAGEKISLQKTVKKLLTISPQFVRTVFLEVIIYLGIILFTGLSGLTLWTVLPNKIAPYFIVPILGFGTIFLWHTILRFTFVNYKIFDKHSTIFDLFNYKLTHKQIIERWLFSIILMMVTVGGVLAGGYALQYGISFLPSLSTSIEALSYLSGLILSITIIVSSVISIIYTGVLTMYNSRIYHLDFSKIVTITDANHHDYHYESQAVRIWTKYRKLILIASLITVIAFSSFQAQAIQSNLNKFLDHEFVTMAHRGGVNFPENTLEAVRNSIDTNIDMVEVDVQITADQKPILYHDQTLQKVGSSNVVSQTPYTTIKQQSFETGEKIITLEELLEASRDKIGLNIELKVYNNQRRELVTAVLEELSSYKTNKPIIISSLDYETLTILQEKTENYTTGLIITASIGTLADYNVDWFIVNNIFYSSRKDQFKNSNKKIALWSFSTSWDGSQAFEEGVDAGITDKPDELLIFANNFHTSPLDEQIRKSLLWSLN